MEQIFDIETQTTSYPIFCAGRPEKIVAEFWDRRWRQAAFITDENTARFATPIADSLRARGIKTFELAFPAGEASKTRQTKAAVEDRLLDMGFSRNGCIVAVGGGVTLDLAGFVAATYMRGVPHINVATTVLAQVDAAIGGKTGVNTPHGKNLVGAFRHPRAVVLDVAALSTLPRVELTCGMAELIKHAILGDAALFDELASLSGRFDIESLSPLIARGAQIKARVVAQDETENGLRRVLNLGHTIGHGIERAAGYRIRHGEAVAIGLVVEAEIARRVTGLPSEQSRRIAEVLAAFKLPVRPCVPFESVAAHMRYDKKTENQRWRFALPKCIGEMERFDGEWVGAVEAGEVAAAFNAAVARRSCDSSF